MTDWGRMGWPGKTGDENRSNSGNYRLPGLKRMLAHIRVNLFSYVISKRAKPSTYIFQHFNFVLTPAHLTLALALSARHQRAGSCRKHCLPCKRVGFLHIESSIRDACWIRCSSLQVSREPSLLHIRYLHPKEPIFTATQPSFYFHMDDLSSPSHQTGAATHAAVR